MDEETRALVRAAQERVRAAEAARADRDDLVRELLGSRRATRREIAQELGLSVQAVRKIAVAGQEGGAS